jgi:hypothetical protein
MLCHTLTAKQAELACVGQRHDKWRVAALAGSGHELQRQLANIAHVHVGAAVVGLWLEGLQQSQPRSRDVGQHTTRYMQATKQSVT